jgi:putative membrane protein
MKSFAISTVATAAAFALVAYLLPQIGYSGSIGQLLVLAIVFGVVNGLIRPIVKLLTLPVTVMTLGLFGIVINAGMLLLTAAVAGGLDIPFQLGTFPPDFNLDTLVAALVGAVAMSIVLAVVDRIVPD